MIVLTRKEDCCGCAACANACPKNCITMAEDSEGFMYPKVDEKKCSNCGACTNICPIVNNPSVNCLGDPKAYASQNIDEQIRQNSASGGMFSAIAKYVLEKKGIVFGASFDGQWNVVHEKIESLDDLWKFQGSKYVQSDIGFVYKDVKKSLDGDKWVCFSGTPCQIAGLRNFLKKDYQKLVLVDVICHGVPSPKVWRKYLAYHQEKHGAIEQIFFRNKKYGFAGSTMAIYFKSGKKRFMGQDLQFHKESFFRNLSTRPSCYKCAFKSNRHVSDFSLFDCWHINKFCSSMDDDKGTSAVLIHSSKGEKIFKEIANSIKYKEVDFTLLKSLDGSMILNSTPCNMKRYMFFRDIDILSIPEMVNRYTPSTLKKKLTQIAKPVLYKFGVLNKIKRLMKGLV